MKIAIDIREAAGEKAGKGWYTFYITKKLLEIDKENEYLLYSRMPVPGFEEYKNAKLKIVSRGGIFWHRSVAKDALKENVDVFFAPTSFIIPSILSRKIKSVITVHDLIAFLFSRTHSKKAVLLEKIFLRQALKKCSHVFSVSANTKGDLIKLFGAEEEKISVVPCAAGSDFKKFDKEKIGDFIEQTNLPKNFFLSVGTLISRKNYPNLLRAFAEISRKYSSHHLIIVGANGGNLDELNNFIRTHYLSKKVHILGYVSNKSLVNLYNLATAFVFPSYYEGFGIPLLEAMKCGCPVLASETSSIPEVAGESALFFDPSDPGKIAGLMENIIVNEKLRADLSEKGLKRAEEFSWDVSAGKILEIFGALGAKI